MGRGTSPRELDIVHIKGDVVGCNQQSLSAFGCIPSPSATSPAVRPRKRWRTDAVDHTITGAGFNDDVGGSEDGSIAASVPHSVDEGRDPWLLL